ncbi:helix-turn-helix domain-containing protein [Chondrinema litorale]|uniref:helix-turn-helix domain-containing protein n=1 Tax=Chondrinema litorale TaxID=2994555 RepID=UPI002543543A|nr:helix-turn-helix transcriptional regulator [Chondrinema litorale]UZR97224.1 helix-turn-helix transcriptional regulator [Chondrinema litorale]
MRDQAINRIKSVSEYHKLKGLSSPDHPLISVIDFATINNAVDAKNTTFIFDLYAIALKRGFKGKMKYGQQEYDFDEGVLSFIGPGQVFSFDVHLNTNLSGFLILFHPDFLWNTALAKSIKSYEFFNYSVNEALFLSSKEEHTLKVITENIITEYNSNIDEFSQHLIINQLESFLLYSDRFYHRQFLTRKKSSNVVINQFEEVLEEYVNSNQILELGIPTVKFLSHSLNISSNYLSRLLKTLTGKSTQQHIHDKLIDTAKIKLSTTNLSIGEIAMELGFEHSQSFSKLFKAKTNFSPVEFRQSFA